jgi:gliding motility-associated-like protein
LGSSQGNNISYFWEGPAGGIISGADAISATVQLPGLYSLIVVNEGNGCSNVATALVMQNITAPTVNLPEEVFLSCLELTALIQPIEVSQGSNFNYEWSTPDGNIVQVQNLVNALVDEEGRYFLQVSDNTNGCVSTDSVPVGPPQPLAGAVLDIQNPCWGDSDGSIVVTQLLGGRGPFTFTLTGGPFPVTGFGAFGGLRAGTYHLTIQDANRCEWDTAIVVAPLNQIVVDLGPDITILLGEDVRLEAQVNLNPAAIASFSWTPTEGLSCTDCYDPLIVQPLDNLSYAFTVIDTNGCSGSDFIHIYVDKRPPVFIPNIFSPNGDGINDRFMIFAGDAVKRIKQLKIFDRWGNMVFKIDDFLPNDPQFGWDGRFNGQMMNNAVFVYYTVVELINGKEVVLKGDVTLAK